MAVEDNGRVLGTVQWFSRVKGFGFIRPDGDEEDVFIHYSLIQGEGYRNLSRGQRVEFTMEDTAKGPQAVDAVGLETETEQDAGVDRGGLETQAELGTGEGAVGLESDPVYGAGAGGGGLETQAELGTGEGAVGLESDPVYGAGAAEL